MATPRRYEAQVRELDPLAKTDLEAARAIRREVSEKRGDDDTAQETREVVPSRCGYDRRPAQPRGPNGDYCYLLRQSHRQ